MLFENPVDRYVRHPHDGLYRPIIPARSPLAVHESAELMRKINDIFGA